MFRNLLNQSSVPRYMCYFHCCTNCEKRERKDQFFCKCDRNIIEIKKKT